MVSAETEHSQAGFAFMADAGNCSVSPESSSLNLQPFGLCFPERTECLEDLFCGHGCQLH